MVKELNKSNKKIFAIALLLITLISYFMPISNAANEEIDIYTKGNSSELLQYYGEYYLVVYNAYKKNNKEFWVYNVNYPVYNYNNPDPLTKQKVDKTSDLYKVIMNGFPYKTLEELNCKTIDEAYTATQTAIYCLCCGHDENAYTYFEGNDASIRTYNALHIILENVRNSNFDDDVENESIIKLIDGNISIEGNYYLSKEYKIRSNHLIEDFEVKINGFDTAVIVDSNNYRKTKFQGGETFKILLPIEDLVQDGEFEIIINTKKASSDLCTESSSNGENIYVFDLEDSTEVTNVFIASYNENISAINLDIQANDTKVGIENAMIELLDEYENVLYTYTSDEKGKIFIEHLLPGKYFIKQISTDEEYNIFTKPLEIDMEYGKVINLNISNVPKDITNTHNITENINISEEIIEHNIVNDIISRTINEKTYITNETNNEIAYIDNNLNTENNIINNEKEFIENNENTVDNITKNEKETIITNNTNTKKYVNGELVEEKEFSNTETIDNSNRLSNIYSESNDIFNTKTYNDIGDLNAIRKLNIAKTNYNSNIDNIISLDQDMNMQNIRVLPRTGM